MIVPGWMEIHEAGHAVLAMSLGWLVRRLDVAPALGLTVVTLPFPAARVPVRFAPALLAYKAAGRTAEIIAGLNATPLSEEIRGGARFGPVTIGVRPDGEYLGELAAALLEHHGREWDLPAVADVVRSAESSAEQVLRRHWADVLRIAERAAAARPDQTGRRSVLDPRVLRLTG